MTNIHKAAREALLAWWEDHRPMGWTAEQHRAQPTVNAQSETDKPLMEIAAAASRAALSEAPGESAELPPLPECYVTSGGRDLWSEEQVREYAARAMLAARPSVPQGEPVAEIVGGILRWHIPDAGWALPQQYLRGVHLLYAARPSTPTVALTDERRTRINDPRNAAALAAIRLRLQTDPDYARQTLESAGILTPDGSLAPEFGGKEGGA